MVHSPRHSINVLHGMCVLLSPYMAGDCHLQCCHNVAWDGGCAGCGVRGQPGVCMCLSMLTVRILWGELPPLGNLRHMECERLCLASALFANTCTVWRFGGTIGRSELCERPGRKHKRRCVACFTRRHVSAGQTMITVEKGERLSTSLPRLAFP